MRCSTVWNRFQPVVRAVSDETTFSRVSGMTAAQRDALVEQFDKASRIASAEPVAVVGMNAVSPAV